MTVRKLLLVEGRDDEHVLRNILARRGLREMAEILPAGGVERILESLPVRLKESDVDALGIIVDADVDLAGRWQSLRDRLLKASYAGVPAAPDPKGTVLEPPSGTLLPRVGVWIMPNNAEEGILEDFLRFLVPEGDPLFEHVEKSVASIPEGERRFKQPAEPKARIHTWLAWQEDPGTPLGLAITKRFLDPDAAPVEVLVGWLQRLYEPASS